MKKIIFAVILTCSVFSRSAFAQTEIWRDITSRDDLIGRWEGRIVQNISRNVESSIPETTIDMIVFFEYVQITEKVNVNLKIDMNQFLTDFMKLEEIRSTGFTKENLWDLLGGLFTLSFNSEEDFEIGKYYFSLNMSMKTDGYEDSNFLEDDSGKFQINANKNKLKLIFFHELSFGLGDANIKEIILDKK